MSNNQPPRAARGEAPLTPPFVREPAPCSDEPHHAQPLLDGPYAPVVNPGPRHCEPVEKPPRGPFPIDQLSLTEELTERAAHAEAARMEEAAERKVQDMIDKSLAEARAASPTLQQPMSLPNPYQATAVGVGVSADAEDFMVQYVLRRASVVKDPVDTQRLAAEAAWAWKHIQEFKG